MQMWAQGSVVHQQPGPDRGTSHILIYLFLTNILFGLLSSLYKRGNQDTERVSNFPKVPQRVSSRAWTDQGCLAPGSASNACGSTEQGARAQALLLSEAGFRVPFLLYWDGELTPLRGPHP